MIKVMLSNNKYHAKSPRTNRMREMEKDMQEKRKQRENQAAGPMRPGETLEKGEAAGQPVIGDFWPPST